jgi:hypothetical protein
MMVYPKGFTCYVDIGTSTVRLDVPPLYYLLLAVGVILIAITVIWMAPFGMIFADWKRVIVDGQRPKGFRTAWSRPDMEKEPLIYSGV